MHLARLQLRQDIHGLSHELCKACRVPRWELVMSKGRRSQNRSSAKF